MRNEREKGRPKESEKESKSLFGKWIYFYPKAQTHCASILVTGNSTYLLKDALWKYGLREIVGYYTRIFVPLSVRIVETLYPKLKNMSLIFSGPRQYIASFKMLCVIIMRTYRNKFQLRQKYSNIFIVCEYTF